MNKIDLNDYVGNEPRLCVIEFSDGTTKRTEVTQDYYGSAPAWLVYEKAYKADGTPRNGKGASIVSIRISAYSGA